MYPKSTRAPKIVFGLEARVMVGCSGGKGAQQCVEVFPLLLSVRGRRDRVANGFGLLLDLARFHQGSKVTLEFIGQIEIELSHGKGLTCTAPTCNARLLLSKEPAEDRSARPDLAPPLGSSAHAASFANDPREHEASVEMNGSF